MRGLAILGESERVWATMLWDSAKDGTDTARAMLAGPDGVDANRERWVFPKLQQSTGERAGIHAVMKQTATLLPHSTQIDIDNMGPLHLMPTNAHPICCRASSV